MSILNLKNISYDCKFSQRFAGGTDTLKTTANIALERKNKDTILGCNMKMNSQFVFFALTHKTELFYNGKNNIAMNHSKKRATIDTTGNRGRGTPALNMIKQNFPTANMMNHYTEKLPYESFFKYTNKLSLLEDTKIGNYSCYKIQIVGEDKDLKKRTIILYIDKETYLPIRRVDLVDVNKKMQYSDFTLSEIKTNNPSVLSKIKPPSIPSDYEVDYHRADRF